jgi:simple sugar transport system permease protein
LDGGAFVTGWHTGRHAAGQAITAWLRDRFHANEILVSLMLVYVAIMVLGLFGLWPVERSLGLQLSANQNL